MTVTSYSLTLSDVPSEMATDPGRAGTVVEEEEDAIPNCGCKRRQRRWMITVRKNMLMSVER